MRNLLRIGGLLRGPARSLDDSSGHMADFNVLRNWKIGDTREFTEEEIHQLEIDGRSILTINSMKSKARNGK